MRGKHNLMLAAVAALATPSWAEPPAQKITQQQLDFFEKKVRPALIENCYKCHSTAADKAKGGLRVDTRDSLLKGGDSGPAIVPGKPDKSLLIKAIRHENEDLTMPPKGEKLPDEVIADLAQWVRMGAPDPRDGGTAGAGGKMDLAKAREHWSFKPVSRPPVPKPDDRSGFVRTPVDAFVLAKLRDRQLEHSPRADKRTLLRRATYDLTGLPPTPEEMEAFLADESPDAFAKVVDRLLASPRYGERWGRHWLDIARYADTSGDRQAGGRDPLYPHAWAYRDWVIGAFNNDMPYDQFIIRQIAADKLPQADNDPRSLAALGFLMVGKRFMNNENEIIDDRIDVVTKGLMGLTVSCARCHDHKFDPIPTRDYYSLHGVFASSVEPKEAPLLAQPKPSPAHKDFQKQVAAVEQEIAAFRKTEQNLLIAGMMNRTGDYLLLAAEAERKGDRRNSLRLFARERGLDPVIFELWFESLRRLSRRDDPVFGAWFRFAALPQKEFAAKAPEVAASVVAGNQAAHPLVARAFAGLKPASLKDAAAVYTRLFDNLRKELKAPVITEVGRQTGRRTPAWQMPAGPLANADMESLRVALLGDNSPLPPDERQMARVLGVQFSNREGAIRAKIHALEMNHPGAPARAMTLQDAPRPRDSRVFIRGEPRNPGPVAPRQFLEVLCGPDRKPFNDGSGRLELARSIASRDNPLTARVLVNHAWQWHFGQPLVRTVSDFGTRSEPPTHPELLDWLASWFMDNGWSLKKLHRLIMMSGVYQQDSRGNPRAMAVDGANQWLWRFNIRRLDFEEIRDTLLVVGGKLDLTAGGPPVDISGGERNPQRAGYTAVSFAVPRDGGNRRTVYGFVDRERLPEMFNAFDFANPDMTTGERITTTVPQQALFMMNSPLVAQQVRHLLARPGFKSQGTDEDRVRFLYRVIFQRPPSATELELSRGFLARAMDGESTAPASQPPPPAGAKGKDKRFTKGKGNRSSGTPPTTSVRALNAWERFTQVLLLSNEFSFVN